MSCGLVVDWLFVTVVVERLYTHIFLVYNFNNFNNINPYPANMESMVSF
jgi:hypothetical protein